ncbi:MAG: mercuric transporter MerT family protein [Oceanococcus sp.]
MEVTRSKLAITTGIAAGVGASVCCVAPLLFVGLGLGGSWLSALTAFEPYRPIFIGVAALALVIAYRSLFLAKPDCEDGRACANPEVRKRRQVLFWSVAVVVSGLVASPYLIPLVV